MSEAAVKTKKPSKVNARLIGDLAPYIGLVLVVIVFGFLTNWNLVSATNLQAMSSNVITTAMCTIGAVFVFGAGYFDMAIGGSLCFAAVLGAMATISSGSLFIGAIAILAVSLVLACIKATLASFVNVPFFIFTIILGSIFSAIVLVIMGNETTLLLKNAAKPIPEFSFGQMSTISIICLVIFFIICVILFQFTPIGPKAKNGRQCVRSQAERYQQDQDHFYGLYHRRYRHRFGSIPADDPYQDHWQYHRRQPWK